MEGANDHSAARFSRFLAAAKGVAAGDYVWWGTAGRFHGARGLYRVTAVELDGTLALRRVNDYFMGGRRMPAWWWDMPTTATADPDDCRKFGQGNPLYGAPGLPPPRVPVELELDE